MKKIFFSALLLCSGLLNTLQAQQKELKYNFNDTGSHYIKATFMNQVWLRYNQSNPGTTVNGAPADNTFDIGLRRTRLQLFGQLSDHVFFYTQFGMNNFSYIYQSNGNRKVHGFFHDALGEYKVFKDNNQLKIGAGLTLLNGLSRFSQPSASTIMTGDLPVFAQVTVEQTDQFARRLALYARGQAGKIDYRIGLANPFPIQTNGQAPPALGPNATFTTYGHTKQYEGLLIYNFFDKEPHTTPAMVGTYLGDRKVLNLEGGVIYQNDATWSQAEAGTDTAFHNMLLWSVAAFADMPLKDNKYALNAYVGYFNTDYGPNYLRNNGIMNPANGNTSTTNFSGPGNSYPMFGTGSSVYAQAGLRLPQNLLGDQGTLMPYISYRTSDYDRLDDRVTVWNGGVNWLINKYLSKITLNYESRPVFEVQPQGNIQKTNSKSSIWLQFQTAF
ncbi:MAG: OprO/OprP family phosphate-selective porin [Hymenobacteraceae bacterium]|nr:OprO/OprP family phosphate-selective porin [Hymenobacteraceae bacterium]MDX5397556.1 OprO/OprP family phosphate-selective porin [Hymenobacteraceae bacterium]MDX5442514.1 OprO/OprP family phosphate-selective porin [Hymenobacteraceae bacterium]MDX5513634.1 OprO/OprP family phosphate-selective porin [Hymenobacteraceae bacterium]